jgi:penicillin-binding protein 1A
MGVEPGNDPKAAVIWEAFKPDTEPRQYSPEDEFARRRDALVAEIRGVREARQAAITASSGEQQDFAEQQGGVY